MPIPMRAPLLLPLSPSDTHGDMFKGRLGGAKSKTLAHVGVSLLILIALVFIPSCAKDRPQGISGPDAARYDSTIEAMTKLIRAEPKNAPAYNNRANALSMMGRYDEAVADYTQAVSIDPGYSDAYNNRGGAYYDLKQYDKAIADFNKAVALDPANSGAFYNRANCYYYKKLYNRAIDDYNKAILLDPQNGRIHFGLGRANAERGLFDRALGDFRMSCTLSYAPGCTEEEKMLEGRRGEMRQ